MHTSSSSLATEKKGTWLAIISGLLYGLLGYFGVSLIQSGLSVLNLSFWRFFTSFLFLAIIFLCRSSRHLGDGRQIVRALINGAIFYGAPSSLFFVASRYIGTGQSMVIFFSYPLFVMFFNWLFEGKALTAHYLVSFVLIVVGLVFLVDIGEVGFDFMGIGLSLLSAVSYAAYIVSSKRVRLSAFNSTMMVSLGCALSSGFLAVVDNSLALPVQLEQWVQVLSLGILCTAFPILLMLESMKYISSDKASLLSVLEPVFTVIFGVLLLGEVLKLNSVIGIILTLMGAMTVTIKWKNIFVRKRTV